MTENKNEIYMYWSKEALTLIDRALKINSFVKLLAIVLDERCFRLSGNSIINIDDESCVDQILEDLKGPIRKHYKIKSVPDEFKEDIGSIVILRPALKSKISVRLTLGGEQEGVPSSLVVEGLQSFVLLDKLFKESIDFFKPSWGVITQFKFVKEIAKQTLGEYWFGGKTYFSSEFQLPEIPSQIKLQKLRTGTILVVSKNEFDLNNIEHINGANMLVNLFREKKYLRNSSYQHK